MKIFWVLFRFLTMFLIFFSSIVSLTVQGFTGTYGINYGRIADNIPSPDQVVTLLRAAKIKNVRIYDADHSVLKAFSGTGLELVVGLPNDYVKDMSANADHAVSWVKENVQSFLPGTNIRGIAVGNEILGGGDTEMWAALLTLMLKYKIPRPLMMTFVLLLSCVGHLLVAFPGPGAVYVASIIIGFSFGAQLPLLFAIISELFGLKYYSTLFNCGQLASPLGSYLLNVRLTGKLYDREAIKDLAKKGLTRSSVKELTCIGTHCFRLPFIILAAGTLFGALVSLILVVRTRKFYSGDIYKKFRDDPMVTDMIEPVNLKVKDKEPEK